MNNLLETEQKLPALQMPAEPRPLDDLQPPSPSAPVMEKPAALLLSEQEKSIAAESKVYWRHLLTGDAATVPDEVRRRAGADDAALEPEERDYRVYSTVNRSWYADHRGVTREKVRAEWPRLRRHLAEELSVADDEREVFLALSARHDEEKLRAAARAVYERSYRNVLLGEEIPSMSDVLAAVPPEYRDSAQTIAAQAAAVAEGERARLLPLVHELSESMEGIAALEEDMVSAPQFFSSVPHLIAAVDELADMEPAERQTVLSLAVHENRTRRAESDDEAEGMSSRVLRSVRRGAWGLGMGVMQGINHLGIATLDNIGGRMENAAGTAMQTTAAAWDKRMQVLREIRHATQQELIPLNSPQSSLAEDFMLHAAEAVPSAILACTGGAGFATLTSAGMGDAVAEARLRSPETPQQLQLAAGVVGGAVQASIFMGVSRIGGRLLEKTINNFMQARGQGVGAFSWAALNAMAGMTGEGVKLMLAGKAAQATDLGIQELASRAASTASGIDWQQFGDNMTDVEVNMREAASLLPFLLIGAGRVALRHFRSPHSVVGNGTRLLEWGIDEPKVTQILNERRIEQKGELLREALCGSKLWSAPGFILEAVKALRLLNTDYFKGFETPEVVRDFLKLPAESSLVQRHDYGARSIDDMVNTPGHAQERSGYYVNRRNERFKSVLSLWDEWWTRSHIDAHSSRLQLGEWQLHCGAESARYERSSRYLSELKNTGNMVPERMRALSAYAPHAERERRALLRDRVAELQDLSYQFLMNVNPLESLMHKDFGLSRIRHDTERMREEFLGNVGKVLVNAGLGMSREENLGKLCDWFQGYYLRKKYRERSRGARIDWLREVPMDFLRNMSKHANYHDHIEFIKYPELLEAYRIFLGVRTNAELLMDLLPMTEDFQTALSRGMSPAQAYAHLAERELGYQPKNLKNYPTLAVEMSENLTPMPEYTRMNEEKCRAFMQLTGASLEQQQGDDGNVYWRLRRPDGSFSRWHESAAFAMNDVAANAAISFLPLGHNLPEYWAETARTAHTDLTQLPIARDDEFSAYDSLCHRALSELTTLWMESAPYLQPGMRAERLRYRFIHNRSYGSGVSPMQRNDAAGEFPYLTFDTHTMATPVGMATARFYTAWLRLLDSATLPLNQAVQFLQKMGGKWAQDVENLPPPEKMEQRASAVADAMARFSLHYFLVKLPQLPLPACVKEWVAYAAFCPPTEDASMPDSVVLGNKHAGIIRWSNRRIAGVLREQMPEVALLRERLTAAPLPDALVERLMQGVLGKDPVQQAEQTWCCHYSGAEALRNVSQSFMNLLQSPVEWWQRMGAVEQHLLAEYLRPYCSENLPPHASEGEDAVVASIRNLDAALKQYPQLHRMSFAGKGRERVLTLELPPLLEPDPLAEPDFRKPAFPYVRDVQEFAEFRDVVSEHYAETALPSVQHALRFLDVLRLYPADLPYATDSGICWRQLTYGGKNGKHPGGLELHKVARPLVGVRRLLKEVHELCADKQVDSIKVCGVSIPNVTPEELDCPALKNITVYRQMAHAYRSRSITHLCRLMPGEPSAPDMRERNPYVTESRDGVYISGNTALRDASDPQAAMVPLQAFAHAVHRAHTPENRQQWSGQFIKHALDGLCALDKADAGFMEHRICNGISLPEILMRLYEDTNFSTGVIGRQSIHELSAPVLRTLALAADLIACIAAPLRADDARAVRAFERLQNTVRRIGSHEENREALEYILGRGPQLLLDKVQQATPIEVPTQH